MRKPFNTSIEDSIQTDFKQACDKTIPKLPMNTVLELLMDGYNKGYIKVITGVESVETKGK